MRPRLSAVNLSFDMCLKPPILGMAPPPRGCSDIPRDAKPEDPCGSSKVPDNLRRSPGADARGPPSAPKPQWSAPRAIVAGVRRARCKPHVLHAGGLFLVQLDGL